MRLEQTDPSALDVLWLLFRYFIDVAGFVISRPFTSWLSVLEVSGSHNHAVLAIPLPVTRGDAVEFLAAGPKTSVLVVVQIFLRLAALLCHFVATPRATRIQFTYRNSFVAIKARQKACHDRRRS